MDYIYRPGQEKKAKFILFSLLGIFLFLIPLPTGDGGFNIVLGHVIDWLAGVMDFMSLGTYAPDATAGEFGLAYLLALIFLTVSFLGAIFVLIAKPRVIMETPMLKSAFVCSPVYLVSRGIGFALIWMLFLGIGPDLVINNWTGDTMLELTAGLVVLFIVLGPTLPILTDFGLMEFAGVFMRKVVRKLFTVPGRASIDFIASWFGSSNASVLITRDQLEKGQYTVREAAVITVNFSFVSLPFTFYIANYLNLSGSFLAFYGVISIVIFILALVTPRIWPLSSMDDEYLDDVGDLLHEDVPPGLTPLQYAVESGSRRANTASLKDVAKAGADAYLGIFLDLMPVILAWGTIALVISETTPVFEWLSFPFRFVLEWFQMEPEYAPAIITGFVDMFIPAIKVAEAPVRTAFIIGALSIVQLVYLSETGVMIMKSKMQLNIGKLAIIFMIRTLIGLPLIVGITALFSMLGWTPW